MERQRVSTWGRPGPGPQLVLAFLGHSASSERGREVLSHTRRKFKRLRPCSLGTSPSPGTIRLHFLGLCVSKWGSWQLVGQPTCVLSASVHEHPWLPRSKVLECWGGHPRAHSKFMVGSG